VPIKVYNKKQTAARRLGTTVSVSRHPAGQVRTGAQVRRRRPNTGGTDFDKKTSDGRHWLAAKKRAGASRGAGKKYARPSRFRSAAVRGKSRCLSWRAAPSGTGRFHATSISTFCSEINGAGVGGRESVGKYSDAVRKCAGRRRGPQPRLIIVYRKAIERSNRAVPVLTDTAGPKGLCVSRRRHGGGPGGNDWL